MINLLPIQQKIELLKERRLKLILIIGILFLSFLVSFALILFSIKIYIFKDLEIQKVFLEEKKKELSFNQNLEKEIKDYNLILADLNNFYQRKEKSDLPKILEKIANLLPKNIYLTNLTLRGEGKEKPVIFLSGFSPNREKLVELKDNLENEKDLSDIYFPPENWMKETNINFNISFKLEI